MLRNRIVDKKISISLKLILKHNKTTAQIYFLQTTESKLGQLELEMEVCGAFSRSVGGAFNPKWNIGGNIAKYRGWARLKKFCWSCNVLSPCSLFWFPPIAPNRILVSTRCTRIKESWKVELLFTAEVGSLNFNSSTRLRSTKWIFRCFFFNWEKEIERYQDKA